VTVPVIVPRVVCARADHPMTQIASAHSTMIVRLETLLFIASSETWTVRTTRPRRDSA
jgi:hypothetical protein